jgi:hypothetical protein
MKNLLMFLLFVILSNPDCKSYDLEYGIANPVQRVSISGLEKDASLTISDIWGRNLKQHNFNSGSDIDISKLPIGIYKVKVQDSSNLVIKTLVVE